MAQTAAHLVDHVVPQVPVRQRVLSLPIPLRLLLAAQPKLVTPVLPVVHRVITRWLCRRSPRRPPKRWRLPSARRTVCTTERRG